MPGAARDIVLIGLRGSGKSTIARALARRLGLDAIDLDEITPTLAGCATVRECFESLGESGFREAEARALASALGSGRVIALGGGTPTAPGAADLLRKSQGDGKALIVYLRAAPQALRARLAGADNADRPSLTGAGALDEIPVIFAQRDPLYTSLAGVILDTDHFDEHAVLDTLADACRGAT